MIIGAGSCGEDQASDASANGALATGTSVDSAGVPNGLPLPGRTTDPNNQAATCDKARPSASPSGNGSAPDTTEGAGGASPDLIVDTPDVAAGASGGVAGEAAQPSDSEGDHAHGQGGMTAAEEQSDAGAGSADGGTLLDASTESETDQDPMCAQLEADYAAQLELQRTCSSGAGDQCGDFINVAPGCDCVVYITPKDPFAIEAMLNLQQFWFNLDCTADCPTQCEQGTRGACFDGACFPE